ncbi:MAG TPA: hypothetical protein VFT79_13050 [Solirubrobacterales bacterium]|nr:hypothetical protein [Solirubrobacterales bacterium]
MAQNIVTRRAKPPTAILVASLMLGIEFILLWSTGYLKLPLLGAAITLLLASLLIFGSRVGWFFVLLGTIMDVVARLGGEQPLWMLGFDGVLLFALVAPWSIRFIWVDRPPRRFPRLLSDEEDTSSRVIDRLGRLPYHLFAWRLGFALLILLVLGGMAEIWKEDAGSDSAVVGVLADAVNTAFSIVLLAFIASICAWAYTSFGPSFRR